VENSTITGWWQLKYLFIFTPKIGEMIQFDDHIFQMDWFNHHLDKNRPSQVCFAMVFNDCQR